MGMTLTIHQRFTEYNDDTSDSVFHIRPILAIPLTQTYHTNIFIKGYTTPMYHL